VNADSAISATGYHGDGADVTARLISLIMRDEKETETKVPGCRA